MSGAVVNHGFRVQAIVDTKTRKPHSFEVLNTSPSFFATATKNDVYEADIQAMHFATQLANRTGEIVHFNVDPQTLLSIQAIDIQKNCHSVVAEIVEGGLGDLSEGDLGRLCDQALLLRKFGYQLAMDDVTWSPAEREIFKRISPDYIKTADWLSLKTARHLADRSRVIAEMVETHMLAEVAKTLGADYMQGFLFDTPREITEEIDNLNKHTYILIPLSVAAA